MRVSVLQIDDDGVHLGQFEASPAAARRVAATSCPLRLGAAVQRDGHVREGLAELVAETLRRFASSERCRSADAVLAAVGGQVAGALDGGQAGQLADAAGAPLRRIDAEQGLRLTVAAMDLPATPTVVAQLATGRVDVAIADGGQVVWSSWWDATVGDGSTAGFADVVRSVRPTLGIIADPASEASAVPAGRHLTAARLRALASDPATGGAVSLLVEVVTLAGVDAWRWSVCGPMEGLVVTTLRDRTAPLTRRGGERQDGRAGRVPSRVLATQPGGGGRCRPGS